MCTVRHCVPEKKVNAGFDQRDNLFRGGFMGIRHDDMQMGRRFFLRVLRLSGRIKDILQCDDVHSWTNLGDPEMKDSGK